MGKGKRNNRRKNQTKRNVASNNSRDNKMNNYGNGAEKTNNENPEIKKSDNCETKTNDKKINKKTVYDVFMLAIALSTFIVTLWIGCSANKLNKKNQPLLLSDITIDDKSDAYYTFSFNKKQGEVKKAYLSTPRGYTKLDVSLDNIQIPKEKVENTKVTESSEDGNYDFIIELGEGTPIYDALDFAVVLLDYSNKWSCYYVMVRPGINLSDKSLKIGVYQEGINEPVGEKSVDLISVEAKYKILETDFVNIDIVDEYIKEFKDFYEIQILQDDLVIPVKSIDDNGNTVDGTVTKKKTIVVDYKDFDADDILNKINSILSDFH